MNESNPQRTPRQKIILTFIGIFVPVFTIWNIYDFCTRGSRSTASYLAVAFNTIAIAEYVKLIRKVIRHVGK